MATPAIAQHKSTSTNYSGTPLYPLGGASAASNSFVLYIPNLSLSGNCLVLWINCPYSATRTITISDNQSNTWPAAAASVNNGTQMLRVYVLPNATSGTNKLTIGFDASLNNCSFQVTEVYNVATSSVVDVSHTASVTGSSTVASGSMTTTAAGELVLQCGFDVQSPSTGSTNLTGITPGSGFTLLQSCVYLGSFVQYQVQSSAGAINPSVTLSGSTDNFLTIGIALKSAAAGTAPSASIRVFREYHMWANHNTPVQFPVTGSLIWLACAPFHSTTYAPEWQITSITSSPSYTWTETNQTYSSNPMPQCWYTFNVSASQTMTITVGGMNSTYGISFVIYDVIGADTSSPVGNSFNSYVGNIPFSATTDVPLLLYSPKYADELVFLCSAIDVGVSSGIYGSNGIVWDTVNYTGQNSNDLMDNVDTYAHIHLTSDSVAFGVIDVNPTGNPDNFNATAIGFRASGAAQVSLPQLVQWKYGLNLSSPNLTLAFDNNTTTGNTIVVICCGYDNATVRTVSSVSLSSGSGTFTSVVAQAGLGNAYTNLDARVAPNITGGTTPTVTVVFSGAIVAGELFIFEFANMPTTIVTDGTASGKAGSASTSLTAPSITTTGTTDIIFSCFGGNNTCFPGQTGWHQACDVPNSGNLAQCKAFTTAQTGLVQTATQTGSAATYNAISFALKAATASTVNPQITGTVSVSDTINPAYVFFPTQTGSVLVTITSAINPLLGVFPALTGSVLVTGAVSTLLQAVPVASGTVSVTGVVTPNLSPLQGVITGSVNVTGSVTFILNAVPNITGTVLVTGTVSPLYLPVLTGTATVTGSVIVALSPIQIVISGGLGVSGSVSVNTGSGTVWLSNGADVGGSGSYVPGTQSVQFIHDNFAGNGDTIQLPNGTFTWSTGVVTTKAITITAQNFQLAVIQAGNISSTANLMDLGKGTTTLSTRVTGLKFQTTGTSNANHFIVVEGSWSPTLRPTIIDNNLFLTGNGVAAMSCRTNGAVICWNTFQYMSSTTSGFDPGGIQCTDDSDGVNGNSWQSLDTMGTNDTTGWFNIYIENNTFTSLVAQALDHDSNTRVVFRNNTINDSGCTSHGQDSSLAGGRHIELYNNTWVFHTSGTAPNGDTYPLNQNYCYLHRAATGILYNNVIPDVNSSTWGNKAEIQFGVFNTCIVPNAISCQTSRPAARQPGQSWQGAGGYSYPGASADGTGYCHDPFYVWNNTGAGNYNTPALIDQTASVGSQCTAFTNWINTHGGSGGSGNYSPSYSTQFLTTGTTVASNDIIIGVAKTTGPNGGWTAYQFPHPLDPGQTGVFTASGTVSVTGTVNPTTSGGGMTITGLVSVTGHVVYPPVFDTLYDQLFAYDSVVSYDTGGSGSVMGNITTSGTVTPTLDFFPQLTGLVAVTGTVVVSFVSIGSGSILVTGTVNPTQVSTGTQISGQVTVTGAVAFNFGVPIVGNLGVRGVVTPTGGTPVGPSGTNTGTVANWILLRKYRHLERL